MLTIEDVEQFHRVFGHPINGPDVYLKCMATPEDGDDGEGPVLPEHSSNELIRLRALRIRLIDEEVRELRDADDNDDPVEFADALFDLLYVVYGAIIALGVPREIGDEVQRSNMSKGVPCDTCHTTGTDYFIDEEDMAHPIECKDCNGQGIKPVLREDGKILKGPNFSPPDIAKIIQEKCNG